MPKIYKIDREKMKAIQDRERWKRISELEQEAKDLYCENSDWGEIIDMLSDEEKKEENETWEEWACDLGRNAERKLRDNERLERISELHQKAKDLYCGNSDWEEIINMLSDEEKKEYYRLVYQDVEI